jgi:hypothetical protein
MRRLPGVALAIVALAMPAVAAYPNGYVFRRAITVAAAVVPSTQVNFPMLVSGTFAYLATFPNGGMVHNTTTLNTQTVPADLIFTSDAAGTTRLNWDIASYTAATGAIEAWIQIPSLSNGTVIYMFYSNLSATTFQGAAASTWGGAFEGVWHMANGTTQSLVDSSGNGNTLTAGGTTAVAGMVDGASSNPGTQPSGLLVTAPTGLYNLTTSTYSVWVKMNALTNTVGNATLELVTIGSKAASITATSGMLNLTIPTNSSYRTATSTTAITTGAWKYVVFTYTTSTVPHIYLNGVEVSYSTQQMGSGTDSNDSGSIGLGTLGNNNFFGSINGLLDEVRIANVVRSASWIATEYNNQSSPSTFATIGASVSMGGTNSPATTVIIME